MKKLFSVFGFRLSVFTLLFFLATLYSPASPARLGGLLSTSLSYGDEITIRTIITPIGSQSEKWGAFGLMVCIGGKPIAEGGCNATRGFKIMPDDITKEEITFNVNDVVIFKDTYPAGNPNHEYDYFPGWDSQSDTIYEVRGSGGAGFSECEVVKKECCTVVSYGKDLICDVSCPGDKWLMSGGYRGVEETNLSSYAYDSCPISAGFGGTWHVRGKGEGRINPSPPPMTHYCYDAYALCCK